jgi:hypothetical protein
MMLREWEVTEGRKEGQATVTSTTDRGLIRQATAWRTSTHSTAAHPPACLQVASGQLVDGVFIIDLPPTSVTPSLTPVTAVDSRAGIITEPQAEPLEETPTGDIQDSSVSNANLDVPSPGPVERSSTGATNDSQPSQHDDGHPALRLRGGADELDGDIIDDWETLSRLPRHQSPTQRRSPDLQEVDRTLRQWKDGSRPFPDRFDQNERELQQILHAIDQWRDRKRGQSSRSIVVDSLEEHIRQELIDVMRRRRQAVDSLASSDRAVVIELMPVSDYGAAPTADDTASHSSQRMVPSGRDLTLAKYLRDPETTNPFDEELDRVRGELAPVESRPDVNATAIARLLRQRRQNIIEDQSIFEAMHGRVDWTVLQPSQIASLVLVERRGRAIEDAERESLINRLRSGQWDWSARYPLDDSRINDLINQVHDFLRNQMIMTVNVPYAKLSLLISNTGILFKNKWSTSPHEYTYLNGRGETEELLGYAASVKRTIEAGGKYSNALPGSKSYFSPNDEERAELPKYAALISPLRKNGIATYGEMAFHLKTNLRGRATFTPHDSFSSGPEGIEGVTSYGNLFPLLVYGPERVIRAAFAEVTGFTYDYSERLTTSQSGGFFEAQIHGDISWKDIDRIVLSGHDISAAQSAKEKLDSFAALNGINFDVEIYRPAKEGPHQVTTSESRATPPAPS